MLGDGLTRLEIVVTSDEADLIAQAVERAREALAGGEGPRPTAADGLMELVNAYAAGRSAPGETPAAPSAEVVVHVEEGPAALNATLEDGSLVSAETLRRLSCDSGLVTATLNAEGTVLDVGRRTRSIPPAIRRALWIRDKSCRFPGCTATRFLHGHHIEHWLHGGRTSLDNLAFLCSYHHRLVHEGGFSIAMDATGEVAVTLPSGRRISAETRDDGAVHCSQSVWDDPGPGLMPVPDWDGEPVDYESAVNAIWPVTQPAASAHFP